mmetsp:Transcript_25058/g.54015  ORF Transcript_25058/g.54015 Transcript_25058/m.54015 type:complete len:81 (-) Transcript_25058:9-251(-)
MSVFDNGLRNKNEFGSKVPSLPTLVEPALDKQPDNDTTLALSILSILVVGEIKNPFSSIQDMVLLWEEMLDGHVVIGGGE